MKLASDNRHTGVRHDLDVSETWGEHGSAVVGSGRTGEGGSGAFTGALEEPNTLMYLIVGFFGLKYLGVL